jgi:hypothetical protein
MLCVTVEVHWRKIWQSHQGWGLWPGPPCQPVLSGCFLLLQTYPHPHWVLGGFFCLLCMSPRLSPWSNMEGSTPPAEAILWSKQSPATSKWPSHMLQDYILVPPLLICQCHSPVRASMVLSQSLFILFAISMSMKSIPVSSGHEAVAHRKQTSPPHLGQSTTVTVS